ncbi:GNAT family N-acetyltransferase [Psychroserpens sp. Hel_I_66]|uniref:GNAT family N-acetyltransferase n=1 Tax=Psychroserpens sp. Hel_I_66 TaxID=1250004 RepID=UPI001E586FFB|nr:GNAT family N-acetyltransferase [Psychroserpens sp. Hel_I_66]
MKKAYKMEVKHKQLDGEGKFFLEENGKEIGEMTYIVVDDHTIDINHTLIDKSYRGKDLGLKLIEKSAQFMRTNNLKAIPSCPYVDKVFSENSKYNDLRA